MAKKKEHKVAIAPTIKALLKGESASFPIARHSTVRCTCSQITVAEPKRFSSSLNREAGTITVTRTA